jgi:formylglycine-generating enzyme required for sulfatase activity
VDHAPEALEVRTNGALAVVRNDFSWYDSNHDGTVDTPVNGSPFISPTHTDASSRVTKSGAYIHTVAWGTSVGVDLLARTFRQGRAGTDWSYIVGFRCARDVPPGGGCP